MSADAYPEALPHQKIKEIFPDIFTIVGTVKMKPCFRFNRNMTIVRQGDDLTLINAVRLNEEGLAGLNRLGKVRHVMKIGAFHGMDDRFYVEGYGAKYWSLPGHKLPRGLNKDMEMKDGQGLPLADARLFAFKTTVVPEAVLLLKREGGILITCDSFLNWEKWGFGFNSFSKLFMKMGGFQGTANLGPGWCKQAKPQAEDYQEIAKLEFKHLLSAHGDPLLEKAHEKAWQSIKRKFKL